MYLEQDLPEVLRAVVGREQFLTHAIQLPIQPSRTDSDDLFKRSFLLWKQASNLITQKGKLLDYSMPSAFPFMGEVKEPLERPIESIMQGALDPVDFNIKGTNIKITLIENLRAVPSRFSQSEIYSLVAMRPGIISREKYLLDEFFLINCVGQRPSMNWENQVATIPQLDAISTLLILLKDAHKTY